MKWFDPKISKLKITKLKIPKDKNIDRKVNSRDFLKGQAEKFAKLKCLSPTEISLSLKVSGQNLLSHNLLCQNLLSQNLLCQNLLGQNLLNY